MNRNGEKEESTQNAMEGMSKKYNLSLMTMDMVRKCVIQSLRYNPKVVPLLIGEAGCGKTPVIQSIAKELGYNYLIVKLANLEKEDLTGYIHLSTDGESYKFVPHQDLLRHLSKGKTLIFFDEINRGDNPSTKAFFNVVDEQKFGDFKLPPETRMVAAMNPANKNYNVQDILAEAALRKRFRVLCCRVDSATYINYIKSGHEEKGHPAVIEYLDIHPNSVYNHRGLEKGQIFASPHAWSRISEALFAIEKEDPDWAENINKYTPVFAGDLGITDAEQFAHSTRDSYIKIKPQDVLFDYDKVAKKVVLLRDGGKQKVLRDKDGKIIKGKTKSKKVGPRTDALAELIDSVCIYAVSNEPDINKIADGFSKFCGDLPEDMFMKLITKFTSECKAKDPSIKYQESLNEVLTEGSRDPKNLKFPGFRKALKGVQATNTKIESESKDTEGEEDSDD